jgi:RsiW-degrading membrane proteinase PrsW (M82 family)
MVAAARALTAVPCHACLGAILGYYVGQGRFNADKKSSVRLGLLVAIMLHGLYDFPLLVMIRLDSDSPAKLALSWGLFVSSMAVLGVEIVWTRRIVKRLRRQQVQADEGSN